MSDPQPIVLALKKIIHDNNYGPLFEAAIASANTYNIKEIKHVKTLDQYYHWLDNLVRWKPEETPDGRHIYNRLCEFYFFLDQPSVKGLQNAIVPVEKALPLTPLSQWIVDFAKSWGSFLDTEESLNAHTLETFYKSPKFNMNEYMAPPSGYKTFNQLFARAVKPGYRPIEAISDDRIIVSAADSTFVGAWPVSADSTITVKDLQWSLHELLEDSPYKDKFENGTFMHMFLNTTDYHRLHVPVGGVVRESRVIQGQAYLDVVAKPVANGEAGEHRLAAVRNKFDYEEFDALDGTGYQFAQTRGLIVLETPIGFVAVLPIGMAQVSSVVMTAEVGKTLFKGEEFSYFQFGGSDHIVLFEAASNVTLSAEVNVHYNQGRPIGTAAPKK